jgi:hypothetical protein
MWIGSIWLRIGTVFGFCEHGSEALGSINCWEILGYLSDWRLLEKDLAPWSKLRSNQWSRTSSGRRTTLSQHDNCCTSSQWSYIINKKIHFKQNSPYTGNKYTAECRSIPINVLVISVNTVAAFWQPTFYFWTTYSRQPHVWHVQFLVCSSL